MKDFRICAARLWWFVAIVAHVAVTTRAQQDEQQESKSTVLEEPYRLLEESKKDFPIGTPGLDANLAAKYSYPPSVFRSLRYSISEQTGAIPESASEEAFHFDDAGVLRTSRIIDRDTVCPNQVTCTVDLTIQVSPAEYFHLIQAKVEIVDLNDNTPQFPKFSIALNLPENSPNGSQVLFEAAHDPDSPQFAIQRYELDSDPDSNPDLFRLEVPDDPQTAQHLSLVLQGELDREVQDSYTVTITAYDGGNPPKSGSVTVNIIITDINDHSPKFDQSTYVVEIPENVEKNRVLLQLTAQDPDLGKNGEIIYDFSSRTESRYGHYFLLDKNTGEISVVGKLDYEHQKQFTLIVAARNTEPNSLPATATVIVNVIDVNDHSPTIIANPLGSSDRVEVKESDPANRTIATLTIRDPDLGKGGEFNCSIAHPDFALEKTHETSYKLLTRVEFDREKQSLYNVTVECQDAGDPVKSSTEIIPVHIVDINDHSPIFTQSVFQTTVKESKEIGDVLVTVSATDRDINGNGIVTYTLDPTVQDQLEINAVSGEISVKEPLDREKREFLKFFVTAADQGLPQNWVRAVVEITILDVDDNVPQFNQTSYTFTVTEHMAVDTFVGQVSADDPDQPPFDRFTYAIRGNANQGNANNFRINKSDGKIFTRFSLDREAVSEYTLEVLAVSTKPDSHGNSSVIVVIHVGDTNDNTPRFVFPGSGNHTVFVTHPLEIGDVVVRVTSVDDDAGQHGQVRYRIDSGNDAGYFYMNADSGDVTVAKDLDLPNDDVHVFNLSIEASNIGTRHRVSTYLTIVYNTTAYALPSSSSDTNRRTVIVIAVVFGILAVVLLVAIILLLYRQRQQKRRASRQRRCAPQPAAIVQPYINTIDRREDRQLIHGSDNDLTNQKKSYSNPALDLEDDKFEILQQPSLQVKPQEAVAYYVRRAGAPGPRHHQQHHDVPQHRVTVYQEEHTVQKPQVARPVMKFAQDQLPVTPSPLFDRDSDSGCADLSQDNGATGRRSSYDSVFEPHHPWHLPKSNAQGGSFQRVPEHHRRYEAEPAAVHQRPLFNPYQGANNDHLGYQDGGPSGVRVHAQPQPRSSRSSRSSLGGARYRTSSPTSNRVTFQEPEPERRRQPEPQSPVTEHDRVREVQV